MEYRKNKIHFIIITLLIITVIVRFYYSVNDRTRFILSDYVGQNVILQGNIIDEPVKRDFSQIFILHIDCIESICDMQDNINARITADRYMEYRYGDNVKVSGKLIMPFNFKSNGGRTFDYINYLAKDDIYYEIRKSNIEIISHDNENWISSRLFYFKSKFLYNLESVLGEPHSALAGGLVVGDKSSLGKELLDDFRRSGLIHIVVLSGYNITIIASSIRRILSFLPRNISIILGLISIILFGMLVGGGATVVRSCIMASIALFAEFIRRDYDVMRALFLAAILMLIHNPSILLHDPSFQLSFLATLGLIILASPIENRISFITERLGIRSLIASTLATQIFISPFILYIMGQISIIGIVVNIIVLPFIPITMLFISITGFLGFISYFLSQLTSFISYILLSYELFIVQYFARLPFASIEVPKFSIWIVVGFYVFYFAIFMKLPSIISQLIFSKKSSI